MTISFVIDAQMADNGVPERRLVDDLLCYAMSADALKPAGQMCE
jgi:hypothetical protein